MARAVRLARGRVTHDEVYNAPAILYSTDLLLLLFVELLCSCLAMHRLSQRLPLSELLISFITSSTHITVVDTGDHSAELRLFSNGRMIINHGFRKLAQKDAVERLLCLPCPLPHLLRLEEGEVGWILGHRFVSCDSGRKQLLVGCHRGPGLRDLVCE